MDREPAPSPLSGADLALLRAARVWGGESASGLWATFPAERRSSLRWGWESGRAGEPGAALGELRREHTAQTRPDLARVHPSWWVRALKHEPASIQRAVAASLPSGVAEALREGLGLLPEDLVPDRPAHPDLSRVAVSLWTVQLVGDLPDRDDDPPVISALTRFDSPTVARLVQTTGLAKWSLTSRPPPDLDRRDVERLAPLRAMLAAIDPRFFPIANRDIESLGPASPRAVSKAGMISFARLLLAAEPYRVRWALQHIPYSTAKSLRALMGPSARKAPMMVRWETDVLRAAWTRLHAEGRISDPWKGAP